VRRCKQRKIRYQHSDSLPVCVLFLAISSLLVAQRRQKLVGGRYFIFFDRTH
jgi:hypothetical protein